MNADNIVIIFYSQVHPDNLNLVSCIMFYFNLTIVINLRSGADHDKIILLSTSFPIMYPNYEYKLLLYSRTPLIRPPSESHWCGRIRGMVAREGFVYEQKALSVTRNVIV